MDGVLCIDKPAGLTSHDVVARVRRWFRTKKVGHVGTLDPFATGVLVLCLGAATRIVEYLVGCDKEYMAVMRLGQTTDTQDNTGTLLAERPVPDVSAASLAPVFAEFLGDIEQIPPMYSAKKIDGTRLYRLARQGRSVERAPRRVTIRALDACAVALPDVHIRVVCSSGTYVRTLAHDLGERLGCGAHLAALRRTRVGNFTTADAASLDYLDALADSGDLVSLLRPIDAALPDFPAVTLDDTQTQHFAHGARLAFSEDDDFSGQVAGRRFAEPPQPDQLCRIYGEHGRLLGLAQWSRPAAEAGRGWILRPRKVLIAPDDAEKP